jgi:hypothetical protein
MSRRIKCAAYIAYLVAMGNAYRIFIGNPEVKRSLGRPKLTSEGRMKIYLREI